MSTLEEIAERAGQENLALLLAGGHAVIAHGYHRTTFDIDLAIRRADREKWLSVMAALGFVLFQEGPAFLQFNPLSGGAPVDLLLINEQTFKKLQSGATANLAGNRVPPVICLRDLVAMKCHAIKHGHGGRIVKDADDVIQLFLINGLNPADTDWRELVLKYGTETSTKSSGASAVASNVPDLEFPDWSGMDRLTPRLSAAEALRLNDRYLAAWLADPRRKELRSNEPKCEIEFIL